MKLKNKEIDFYKHKNVEKRDKKRGCLTAAPWDIHFRNYLTITTRLVTMTSLLRAVTM